MFRNRFCFPGLVFSLFVFALCTSTKTLLAQAPTQLIYQAKGTERLVKLLPVGPSEWVAILAVGDRPVDSWFNVDTQPFPERPFVRVRSDIAIVKLNSAAEELSRTTFGGIGYEEIVDAFVARDGRVTVVGNSDSPDFPALNAIFPELHIPDTLPHAQTWGFVLRTNPSGSSVETATLLGGSPTGLGQGTRVLGAAVDSKGSVYITGITSQADLPATTRAWKRSSSIGVDGKRGEGFLMKLSSDLRSLYFSTFFGADKAACPPEMTACSGYSLVNGGLAVVIGPANQPVVLHGSTGTDLRPTDGAVDRTPAPPAPPGDEAGSWNLFLTRFSADGSSVVWRAGLGISGFSYPLGSDRDNWLLQNSDGSLITVDATQIPVLSRYFYSLVRFDRWSADGSQQLAGRSQFSVGTTRLSDFAVGFDGLIRQVGTTVLPDPITPVGMDPATGLPMSRTGGLQIATFLLTLNSVTLEPTGTEYLPLGDPAQGIASVRPQGFTVFESSGRINTYPLNGVSGPAVLAVTPLRGPAIGAIKTAAYDFVRLLGRDLTPAGLVSASFDRNGDLPSTLAGISVRVAGVLCPLLSVGNDSVELVTPPILSSLTPGSVVEFTVYNEGALVARYPMVADTYNLNVFNVQNPVGDVIDFDRLVFNSVEPLVIRADGSLSSYWNPLYPGEEFTVYLSGGGPTTANITSGRRVDEALPWTNLRAELSLELLQSGNKYHSNAAYFGTAPGLVAGTIQANLKVPDEVNDHSSGPTANEVHATFARIRLVDDSIPESRESREVTQARFHIWIRAGRR